MGNGEVTSSGDEFRANFPPIAPYRDISYLRAHAVQHVWQSQIRDFKDDVHASTLVCDELWMEVALRCAQRALETREIPVDAVVEVRTETAGYLHCEGH